MMYGYRAERGTIEGGGGGGGVLCRIQLRNFLSRSPRSPWIGPGIWGDRHSAEIEYCRSWIQAEYEAVLMVMARKQVPKIEGEMGKTWSRDNLFPFGPFGG